MYKLQEQLRNMYPDSLKIVDDVDMEISRDINKCTKTKPIMWADLRNNNEVNTQISFPNPLKSGVLGFLTQKVFTFHAFTWPARMLFNTY